MASVFRPLLSLRPMHFISFFLFFQIMSACFCLFVCFFCSLTEGYKSHRFPGWVIFVEYTCSIMHVWVFLWLFSFISHPKIKLFVLLATLNCPCVKMKMNDYLCHLSQCGPVMDWHPVHDASSSHTVRWRN